jgi:hypothetical protein
VLKCLAEDAGGGLVSGREQAIVHPLALPPRRNDPCPAEIGEMSRYFRLVDAKDSDEIADADLSVGDEVQQTKARGVGERPEKQVEGRIAVPPLGHGFSICHICLDIYGVASYF